MLELLFLLLPVAAAYGWYMGRRSAQQDKKQEANRLSREYVTGVNFLLSNEQDKAVNLFLEMLKEDSSAIEAHLTLGNLFRSRGEVDRAIRIHQSLMESSSLDYDQRLLATQQLGRDYMVAGLYDRAEDMFSQLIDETHFRESALMQLVNIYQMTSEWQKAIDITERLVRLGKIKQLKLVAHFYCELALQAMVNESMERALALLRKAESADKHCARVSIMLGRIWISKQEDKKASVALERVLEQDPNLVSEVLPMLEECYQRLNAPQQWEAFLHRCVEKNSGSMAELYLAQIVEKQQGLEAAQGYLSQQLDKQPTLRGFHQLVSYYLAEVEDGRAKESLGVLRNMVGEQIRHKPRYRCQKCGFTANAIYWHCPSCRSWSTIKPIRGLDG